MICDMTDPTNGKCVTEDRIDSLKYDWEEFKQNGKRIVGTPDTVNMLKRQLTPIYSEGKEIEEEISYEYKKGDYVIINKGMYKGKYGQIENLNIPKKQITVFVFDENMSVLFKEKDIEKIEEEEYFEKLAKELSKAESEEEEEEEEGEEEEELDEEEEEEIIEDTLPTEKINFENIENKLKSIQDSEDKDLNKIDIVNDQILKCLGLIS